MRLIKTYCLLLCLVLGILSSCNHVHEWPVAPPTVPFYLRLTYDTDITPWHHTYDGETLTEDSLGSAVNGMRDLGHVRYIVRAYPIVNSHPATQHTAEFIFTQPISDTYDFEANIELVPGNYSLMVWSDLVEDIDDDPHHNSDNFSGIFVQGDQHPACTDYRDAFRGSLALSLQSDVYDTEPATYEIIMQRPLAKFEFISDDVVEFIEKETSRITQHTSVTDFEASQLISFEDYIVTIYYVGFMPNTYSLFTDRPTDSSTGVYFRTTVKQISNTEASLGFDYLFIKPELSSITVQISISDALGNELSTSMPINLPLNRSHHTIVRGKFLTSDASGGVAINPDYDGEFNLIIP